MPTTTMPTTTTKEQQQQQVRKNDDIFFVSVVVTLSRTLRSPLSPPSLRPKSQERDPLAAAEALPTFAKTSTTWRTSRRR